MNILWEVLGLFGQFLLITVLFFVGFYVVAFVWLFVKNVLSTNSYVQAPPRASDKEEEDSETLESYLLQSSLILEHKQPKDKEQKND